MTRQRGIDAHSHIYKCINPCKTFGCVGRLGSVAMLSVDAHPTLAPCHTQRPAVMHGCQQMRRRVRRTTPIVSDRPMRKVTIYFAGMHRTAFSHKFHQGPRPVLARSWPWARTFGRHTCVRTRMHQRLYRSCKKSVHDKEILFDTEFWVKALEIAGTVILNTMTQYQVLSASGRADRVSLNKA